jgi:hypothetical protein
MTSEHTCNNELVNTVVKMAMYRTVATMTLGTTAAFVTSSVALLTSQSVMSHKEQLYNFSVLQRVADTFPILFLEGLGPCK